MLNISLRAGVDRFIFGHFNFQNDEIDDAIYSYHHGAMELHIFWEEGSYRPRFGFQRNQNSTKRGGNVKLMENP